MRTYFQIDEPDEFEAAKSMLVRRCAAWAAERGLPANPKVLEAAVLSRHLSVDGRIALWRPHDVVRLMLDWIPTRVIADAAELADAPDTLRTLLGYLAATGLRDPRGGPDELIEWTINASMGQFTEAIADPSRYGMVKYWSLIAREHGVDLGDPAAVDGFRGDLAAGRVDYDAELLGRAADRELWRPPPGADRAFAHLPITLPPDDELAEATARSEIVRRLAVLTRWVAEAGKAGRPLTRAGNLRPADARHLAVLLGTGEESRPVRSGAELREVGLMLAWARQVRLVRLRKNRLVAVASRLPLLDDPPMLWSYAFDTFFQLGDFICEPARGGTARSALFTIFPTVLVDILTAMYGMRTPAPVARLRESIWVTRGRRSRAGDDTDAAIRRQKAHLARDLQRALDILAALGAVEITEGVPDRIFTDDLEPGARPLPGMRSPFSPEIRASLLADLSRSGPLVSLTPPALREIRRRLLGQGREAALVGELAHAPAAQMLGVVCQHYSPETRAVELTGWLAANDADIETLLDAARACPFRGRTASIVSAVAEIHPLGHRLLHRLRSDPRLAPTALAALLESNILTRDDLTEPEQLLVMAEGFLNLLELGGPEAVHAALAEMPASTPEDVLDRVLHSGHPDTQAMEEIRTLVAAPLHALAAPRRLPPAWPRTRHRGPRFDGEH